MDKTRNRFYKTTPLVSSESQCPSGEHREKVGVREPYLVKRLKRYNHQIQCMNSDRYEVPKREAIKSIFGSAGEI